MELGQGHMDGRQSGARHLLLSWALDLWTQHILRTTQIRCAAGANPFAVHIASESSSLHLMKPLTAESTESLSWKGIIPQNLVSSSGDPQAAVFVLRASRREPGGFLRAEGALCQARGAAGAKALVGTHMPAGHAD